MSPVKAPKPPKVGDYSDDFVEKFVTLRGKTYHFRELDVTKFDELVQLATSTNDEGEDMVDNNLLNKLLAVESCVEPTLPTGLQGMPMRLANKLRMVAQEVNYGNEPEEVEKEPDVQEGEPEAEGES